MCLGYDRSLYDRNRYKSASHVLKMLCDIVSKNGNLLLNIPVRADGTIDDKEEVVLKGIADWMDINKESIFGTRPWKVFGEGPASDGPSAKVGNFNEGKGKPPTADDVRFTVGKDGSLYAIALGWPTKSLAIGALGTKDAGPEISSVKLVGSDESVSWKQTDEGLVIEPPALRQKPDYAAVYKLTIR